LKIGTIFDILLKIGECFMESENYQNSTISSLNPHDNVLATEQTESSTEHVSSNQYHNLYEQISEKISHLPQGEFSAEASLLIKEVVEQFAQLQLTQAPNNHFLFPGSLKARSF
jgi:hypothetical protein